VLHVGICIARKRIDVLLDVAAAVRQAARKFLESDRRFVEDELRRRNLCSFH